jgi:hypothetical protein
MSGKITVFDDSFTAGADLSTHQYKGVTLVGASIVNIQGATGVCHGILQDKPRLGEAARVMQSGRSKAYADGSGAAIAAGDRLYCNASGVFLKAAVGTEANQIALAEEPCTIAGGLIDVTLKQG